MHLKCKNVRGVYPAQMKRFALVLLIIYITVSVLNAQSGRKQNPKATPSPEAVKQDDPSGYSESKPQPGRAARITERFPGIGDGSTAAKTPLPAQSPGAKIGDDD